MKRAFLIVSVLLGLLVVFMAGYTSGTREITGNALFGIKDLQIKTCSGGPDKQGTCQTGQHCSSATRGICKIPTCVPEKNCLRKDTGYQEYEIRTDTVDLYQDANDNNPRIGAKVLTLKAVGVQDQGFIVKKGLSTATTDDDVTRLMDTVYIAFSQDGSILNLYKRQGSKAIRFDAFGTAPNSLRAWTPYDFAINHKDSLLPVNLYCSKWYDSFTNCRNYQLTLFDFGEKSPDRGPIKYSNLSIWFSHYQGNIEYLGHADSGPNIADVVYLNDKGYYDLSSNPKDTLLASNLVILNPATHAVGDEVRIRVPPRPVLHPIEL